MHPASDLCLRLRAEPGFALDAVEGVRLRVYPLVMDLTGKREPSSSLEGTFSVFHATAVALVDGHGGEAEFSDARVLAPKVGAMRRRVTASVEPGFQRTECEAVLRQRDGGERRADTTAPLRAPTGRPGYPPLALSRALLLTQCYKPSDPVLEEALADRLSFRCFCGLDLEDETLDETT